MWRGTKTCDPENGKRIPSLDRKCNTTIESSMKPGYCECAVGSVMLGLCSEIRQNKTCETACKSNPSPTIFTFFIYLTFLFLILRMCRLATN